MSGYCKGCGNTLCMCKLINSNVSVEEHHKTYEELYFESLKLIGKYKQENEKLKEQLKESNYTINSLIHHFHRYGMDEESLVILMEVEKAREYLTKYKIKE